MVIARTSRGDEVKIGTGVVITLACILASMGSTSGIIIYRVGALEECVVELKAEVRCLSVVVRANAAARQDRWSKTDDKLLTAELCRINNLKNVPHVRAYDDYDRHE